MVFIINCVFVCYMFVFVSQGVTAILRPRTHNVPLERTELSKVALLRAKLVSPASQVTTAEALL